MKTLDQLTAAELSEVLKHKLAIEKILGGKRAKKLTADGEVKTRKPVSPETIEKQRIAAKARWAKINAAKEAKAKAEAKAEKSRKK